MAENKTSLIEATKRLTDAKADHSERKREEDHARSRCTAALNVLNAAQRAFDQAVADVRKDAPWDSDWHSSDRRNERVV